MRTRSSTLRDRSFDARATERDHAQTVVDANELWARLATLPRKQRAVLVLRYYEGLSDTEIAGVLGCTPGTVRGYASRALAALRVQITQQAPGFVQEGYRR